MNERKVLDYTGWASRIKNAGVNASNDVHDLLILDDRILAMQEKLRGTDIGSFDYESLANNIRVSMTGMQILYGYSLATEQAIEAMDGRFRTALSKGAVEDLSLIRMDDITVDNTIGMKETYMVGYGDSRCAVERTKNKLTLNDFIGGNGAGCMTGYVKEFADLFRSQYLEAGGEEENFSKYLKELYTMGEFDHKKYQPVKAFVSDILDAVSLGFKPLLEGLLQYEFITGETLTDTESLFKVVEGAVGLFTFGISAGGKGVAVVAQNLLAEVSANVTAEAIVHLGEELRLPPIVIAALELLGGVAAGKTVNSFFADEDQLLKQIDVEKLQLESGLKPGTLSNVDARKWYLEQETQIPNLIDDSLPLEQQARQAFGLRNQYRIQARELMSDRQLAESLYATDPNLIWEQIVQKQIDKGLSGDDIYKAIIESSQRSRKSVNQSLGLE